MTQPVVLSTWKQGIAANAKAWEVLAAGGTALDAVERGVGVSEEDPAIMNVGLGGLPDESGRVSLDAAIMDSRGRVGAVAFLEHIVHATSVARLVMENTEHVLLAGEGALEFALRHGFQKASLVTPESRTRWLQWRTGQEGKADPLGLGDEAHDTIGMIALDAEGNFSAACTTSGVGWKHRGRIGDSPLVGAGVYVDRSGGAAVGTGKGELIMRICGSFQIVQHMKTGMGAQEACERAVQHILDLHTEGGFTQLVGPTAQAAFLALSPRGEMGAACLREGFSYAMTKGGKTELLNATVLLQGV